MRTITITGQWVNQFRPAKRSQIMKMIFSLAGSEGYQIRIAGQRWR